MNDLGFKTKLNEREIETSLDEQPVLANIYWEVEFELRSWGIKDLLPYVKSVAVTYVDDQGSVKNREYKGDKVTFTVADSNSRALYPNEIYYTETTCIVYF